MGFRKNDIDGIHIVYLKEKLEHRSLSQSIQYRKKNTASNYFQCKQ